MYIVVLKKLLKNFNHSNFKLYFRNFPKYDLQIKFSPSLKKQLSRACQDPKSPENLPLHSYSKKSYNSQK